MNKYFIRFPISGNVVWLNETSFEDAFIYVESRYGKSWRNLCEICTYQVIAA